MPKKLIIIGSGYIGLEFACIFGNLGTEVHVMFRGDKVLNGFDDEVRPAGPGTDEKETLRPTYRDPFRTCQQ